MIQPPLWTAANLQTSADASATVFRRQRMREPLELYLEYFDKYLIVFEDLLEQTVDFAELDQHANAILTSDTTLEAMRYITGPPISTDDLAVLAEARLSRAVLAADPAIVDRIMGVLRDGLDRRRFPWVSKGREPTESERSAATIASAALLAAQRTATNRRSGSRDEQERLLEQALLSINYVKVATRTAANYSHFPRAGEFCRESILGVRKADFLIGLYDGRCMPVECKVSNSSTNSVKRLNNDAAVKAVHWQTEFGTNNVVPTAVLSGVYKLRNLVGAQQRGLVLFWAHDLRELTNWILLTKN